MFQRQLLQLVIFASVVFSTILSKPLLSQTSRSNHGIPEFLRWYDANKSQVINYHAKTLWAYNTDITSHNEELMKKGKLDVIRFNREAYRLALRFDLENVTNESFRRQLNHILKPGEAVLSDADLNELLNLQAKMLEMYSSAKVCTDRNQSECYDDKGVMDIYANSEDELYLRYLWKLWHEQIGRKMKDEFRKHLQLSNKVALGNQFLDMGSYWRSSYELKNFEAVVDKLWKQLKPFYMQLHAYVRKKLIEIYGPTVMPRKGLIPAHLLDLIEWGGIPVPFENVTTLNITKEMEKKNYTVTKIMEVAEDFFSSLGFPPLPQSFWNNSMFEKPKTGQKAMCHGTAWNFQDKNDFRMLICADVNAEALYTAHHEMGHLQYFIAYKDQPYPFNDGANPAFHEAIGDIILLSVMTPNHLRSIGLLEKVQDSTESDINFLFMEALTSISTMPMSYLIDRWRWDIFAGKYDEKKWNEEWWKLRQEMQGLSPPVNRSEEDFDAGILYHVVSFTPFIRYFLSEIIKYQFHRALCKAAGRYDPNDPSKPLYKCDIYGSKEAGHLLWEMMSLGSSKHWTYAMNMLTQGEEDAFDPSALLEYFDPLITFLTQHNHETGETIGWEEPPLTKPGETIGWEEPPLTKPVTNFSHQHNLPFDVFCWVLSILLKFATDQNWLEY